MLQSLKKENLAMCSMRDGLGAIKWNKSLIWRKTIPWFHSCTILKNKHINKPKTHSSVKEADWCPHPTEERVAGWKKMGRGSNVWWQMEARLLVVRMLQYTLVELRCCTWNIQCYKPNKYFLKCSPTNRFPSYIFKVSKEKYCILILRAKTVIQILSLALLFWKKLNL